jgi:hypothetical protein
VAKKQLLSFREWQQLVRERQERAAARRALAKQALLAAWWAIPAQEARAGGRHVMQATRARPGFPAGMAHARTYRHRGGIMDEASERSAGRGGS